MAPALKSLSQQVVVITGASSGIGLATAMLAARRRARVVMAARSVHALDEVAARIRDEGGLALAVPTDVTDPLQLRRLADQAIAHFGRIDTWVNNAGVSIYGRLEDVDEQDSRQLFDVNFWGTVNGSMVALPWLREQGGALVNLGSEVADVAIPLQGMYAASKHAVKGFTDALRREMEQAGSPVAVTLIEPAAVDPPYPQPSRHRGRHASTPPEPTIDPRRVAHAILSAATEPRRDLKVGLLTHVDTLGFDAMPAVAEWLARRAEAR